MTEPEDSTALDDPAPDDLAPGAAADEIEVIAHSSGGYEDVAACVINRSNSLA